jgi:hypothetical protein
MSQCILVTVICGLIWVFTLSEVKASSLDVLRGRAAFNFWIQRRQDARGLLRKDCFIVLSQETTLVI